MWQPWVARWFPGVTLPLLEAGYWTVGGYVAMADLLRDGGAVEGL